MFYTSSSSIANTLQLITPYCMSCIVRDYSYMTIVKIIVVLTQVTWERERERKNKRWAHLGKGINPESSGREKKHPPPCAAGQPISTKTSCFTWRPKSLCVAMWHHQLPIKGDVTFSFLLCSPCFQVLTKTLSSKPPWFISSYRSIYTIWLLS